MKKITPEGGLDPPALRLKAARSNQLSYPGLLVSQIHCCIICEYHGAKPL